MGFKAGHGPACFSSGGAKKKGGKPKGKKPAPLPKPAQDPWRSAMANAGKTGS